MKIGKLLLASVVASLGVSTPASAAIFSYTSTGVLASSKDGFNYDPVGIFGVPRESLQGAAFTLITTFDTALNFGAVSSFGYSSSYGYAPSTITAIVNGKTFSTTLQTVGWVSGGVSNFLSVSDPAAYDQIYVNASGRDSNGLYISASQWMTNEIIPFVGLSNDLFQNLSFEPENSTENGISLQISNDSGTTTLKAYGGTRWGFSSGIESMSINSPLSSDLPEPKSFALFGIGLVVFALARRRPTPIGHKPA